MATHTATGTRPRSPRAGIVEPHGYASTSPPRTRLAVQPPTSIPLSSWHPTSMHTTCVKLKLRAGNKGQAVPVLWHKRQCLAKDGNFRISELVGFARIVLTAASATLFPRLITTSIMTGRIATSTARLTRRNGCAAPRTLVETPASLTATHKQDRARLSADTDRPDKVLHCTHPNGPAQQRCHAFRVSVAGATLPCLDCSAGSSTHSEVFVTSEHVYGKFTGV